MNTQYRVNISIRVRGMTPMDQTEFKSEHYDDLDEFTAAIKEFAVINIDDYEENEVEDENDEPDLN